MKDEVLKAGRVVLVVLRTVLIAVLIALLYGFALVEAGVLIGQIFGFLQGPEFQGRNHLGEALLVIVAAIEARTFTGWNTLVPKRWQRRAR